MQLALEPQDAELIGLDKRNTWHAQQCFLQGGFFFLLKMFKLLRVSEEEELVGPSLCKRNTTANSLCSKFEAESVKQSSIAVA